MHLLAYLRLQLENNEFIRTKDAERTFKLTYLKSHSRRCFSLFPWAQQHQDIKVYTQDLLLSVAETGNDCPEAVPTFGLEAILFHIPSTQVSLLYIAKADTTGIFDRPSVAKIVSSSFNAWHINNAPAGTDFRVHVFGRSASQYLFPGSVENPHKRVLSDKRLCAWWKSVLESTAGLVNARKRKDVQSWFSLPGYDEGEAKRLIAAKPGNQENLSWSYGHPYSTLSPICLLPSLTNTPTLGDLIPAFPDDPKSRYLTSLTSSPMSAAGEPGDYEDAHLSSLSNDKQLEQQRGVEKSRLASISLEEYWEGLAFRQECCSGAVVGFFCLAYKDVKETQNAEGASTAPVEIDNQPALAHAVYTKLWSTFHNVNYSLNSSTQSTVADVLPAAPPNPTLQRIAEAHSSWQSQIKSALLTESEKPITWLEEATFSTIVIVKGSGAEKRKVESIEAAKAPVVMQLKPRKKAKIA